MSMLHEGDCRIVLPTLEADSFDAVICDPPYPCIKRPYGYWTETEWFELMDAVVPQCRRLLKPTGSAVFVLQPNSERLGRMRPWLFDFQAKWCREWGMVQDVWWWNNAALPEAHAIQGKLTRPSVKACVWLGSHDCYRDQSSVLWRESDHHVAKKASERFDNDRKTYPSGQGANRARMFAAAEKRGGVCPFNLLPVPNQHSKDNAGLHGHGAGTPMNLTRWWVRYICPPGGRVLDPFAGSGTTLIAAQLEGREAVGIEQDTGHCEIIRNRLEASRRQLTLFD